MENLIIEAAHLITSIQLHTERAYQIASIINNAYFGNTDTSTNIDRMKYGFADARIEHDIVMEYLEMITKDAEKLNKLVNGLFVQKEGDTDAAQNQAACKDY